MNTETEYRELMDAYAAGAGEGASRSADLQLRRGIGAVWLAFEAWAATMRRDTLLRICRQWRSDVDEARYLLNTNETSCRAFVEKIARREVLND